MRLHGGNQVAERFVARREDAVLVLLLKLSESTDLRVEVADRACGAGARHGEGGALAAAEPGVVDGPGSAWCMASSRTRAGISSFKRSFERRLNALMPKYNRRATAIP